MNDTMPEVLQLAFGSVMSRTSSVTAIADTPSLNASVRAVSQRPRITSEVRRGPPRTCAFTASVVLCSGSRICAAVAPGRSSYCGDMATNAPDDPTKREAPIGQPLPADAASEVIVLPREECLRLLCTNGFGRLAVAMDHPIIRPVNYFFDEPSQSVVFRTADGSKFHALLVSGNAAFEIDGIDQGSRTGWSVIIVGMAEKITSPSDIRRLERRGLETWAPGRKAHWMRIRAWTVSGRRIVLGADPKPGASASPT